jgi:transposase
MNLRDAVVRLLNRYHREITDAMQAAAGLQAVPLPTPIASIPAMPEPMVVLPAPPEPTPISPPPAADPPLAPTPPLSNVARQSLDRRARRVEQYEQVVALRKEQLSIRAIRKRTGLNQHTIIKYMRAAGFPERARPQTRQAIDRFVDQLRAMWDAGEHNATELHRKLSLLGFTGSLYMVTRSVAPWRKAHKADSRSRPQPAPRRISSRHLSWLLLYDEVERKPDEQKVIDQLRKDCEPLRQAVDFAREFRVIFRERQSAKLLEWIDRAKHDGTPGELKNFAKGLEQDWPCIKSAVELPWSNGRAEGHVNRIKLIKRQMYGRAGFDLLRMRVLARAP